MNIVIVGCGTVGTSICYHLMEEHHNITVVDSSLTLKSIRGKGNASQLLQMR